MAHLRLVAGCIAALIVSIAPRPASAEEVDGHYAGTYSNTGQCSGGGPMELNIKNRSFTRQFGPSTKFDVTVGPDGSFTSQYGQSNLSGSVKGGHLTITMSAGKSNCMSTLTLEKT